MIVFLRNVESDDVCEAFAAYATEDREPSFATVEALFAWAIFREGMYVVFENVLGAESASRGKIVAPVMSVRGSIVAK